MLAQYICNTEQKICVLFYCGMGKDMIFNLGFGIPSLALRPSYHCPTLKRNIFILVEFLPMVALEDVISSVFISAREKISSKWYCLFKVWQLSPIAKIEQSTAKLCVYLRDLLNPLRAKFFRGNIYIYLHFVSFLHIDTTQVVEILSQIRQEPTYST